VGRAAMFVVTAMDRKRPASRTSMYGLTWLLSMIVGTVAYGGFAGRSVWPTQALLLSGTDYQPLLRVVMVSMLLLLHGSGPSLNTP